MKSILALGVLSSLFLALSPLLRAEPGAPLTDDSFLIAKGTALRDHHGLGNVVELNGVNLGGWLEWQDWMCPMDTSKTLSDDNPGHNGYDFEVRRLLTRRFGVSGMNDLINAYEDSWITEQDLDNIKALGMNTVRLTFAYDTLLNEDETWRSDAFTRMDWLVKAAADRGIYTIIDFHGFLPASAEQDGSATGYWSNSEEKEKTVEIWSKIADHFKGNPAIAMYDLLNEPNNSAPQNKAAPTAETVCDLYDEIYHAIRSVDSDHAIAMEGVWGWQTLRDPAVAGYQNVVCSQHWYHFGAQALPANNAATDKDLISAAQMQSKWNIPCFIGEFNFFGDPAAWKYGLAAYNRAGLLWTIWTYKNKAADENSWGVYTAVPGRVPPTPDLTRDSQEDIRVKWKAWSTSSGNIALNPMLESVLKSVK